MWGTHAMYECELSLVTYLKQLSNWLSYIIIVNIKVTLVLSISVNVPRVFFNLTYDHTILWSGALVF